MQFFKRVYSYVFSRQMLAFVAMVLLALLVWLIGPLLAIDGMRPLASVGARTAVIVLLLALGILWLVSGPFHLIGVPALCLLVWHGGPLLAIGAAKPLAPALVRSLVIVAILAVYAIYGLYTLWRKLQTSDDFLNKFLAWGRESDKSNLAKEELKNVDQNVNEAMRQLRGLRGRGGLRRIVEGKRHLYELPWYMIVGSPGAGKTTALLNSGLQFPLGRPGQENKPKGMSLKSASGTMHCDWWFTNDAVLIDTAGRYTVHEDDEKDQAEWNGFLGLLRKHRTRAPLNGVIVALGTDELLSMKDGELVAHGAMVRERLVELRQQLGIRFPVYVVVTKADRLKGFAEYFQSLTTEGRSQAWASPCRWMRSAEHRPPSLQPAATSCASE